MCKNYCSETTNIKRLVGLVEMAGIGVPEWGFWDGIWPEISLPCLWGRRTKDERKLGI